jgi:hypothetical protein
MTTITYKQPSRPVSVAGGGYNGIERSALISNALENHSSNSYVTFPAWFDEGEGKVYVVDGEQFSEAEIRESGSNTYKITFSGSLPDVTTNEGLSRRDAAQDESTISTSDDSDDNNDSDDNDELRAGNEVGGMVIGSDRFGISTSSDSGDETSDSNESGFDDETISDAGFEGSLPGPDMGDDSGSDSQNDGGSATNDADEGEGSAENEMSTAAVGLALVAGAAVFAGGRGG